MRAILLAAGLSKRMGVQKLLLPFGESTVIERVLENMRGAGFSEIIAVFSSEVHDALGELGDGIRAAVNPAPERGQSSSLSIALEMLPDGEDFCIMLGDLPLVGTYEMKMLKDRFSAMPQERTVFTPCRNGVFGHPMFYRAVWKERFAKARGDMGGRDVLRKFEYEIERVEASDSHFKDMDTKEEYEKIAAMAEKRDGAAD